MRSSPGSIELNDFARRRIYVVLAAGIPLGATQIVGEGRGDING